MTRKISFLIIFITATVSAVAQPLSNSDRAGILFMYEEEKLAHDLYVAFGERWGLQIFNNIVQAEQTHSATVSNLAALYEITLPDNEAGVFDDPTLQELYDELLPQGMISAKSALQVGIIVEETDIADLDERIVASENAQVVQVYQQLSKGSQNHLQAFTRNLSRYP